MPAEPWCRAHSLRCFFRFYATFASSRQERPGHSSLLWLGRNTGQEWLFANTESICLERRSSLPLTSDCTEDCLLDYDKLSGRQWAGLECLVNFTTAIDLAQMACSKGAEEAFARLVACIAPRVFALLRTGEDSLEFP